MEKEKAVFSVRLDRQQRQKLDDMAGQLGVKPVAVLRQLVDRAAVAPGLVLKGQ